MYIVYIILLFTLHPPVPPNATAERRQSFEDTLTLASTESEIATVTLRKQRTMHHHASISVEQTDIVAEGHPHAKQWRSICLEGEERDLTELLQRRIKVPLQHSGLREDGAGMLAETALGEYLTQVAGGPPCGYPEFVLKLQHQT